MNQSTELLLPEHISELHLALSGWRALSPLCFLVPAPEIVTVKQRCVHSSLCSEPCTNTHLFVPSGAKPLMRSFLLRAEQAEPSGLGCCDLPWQQEQAFLGFPCRTHITLSNDTRTESQSLLFLLLPLVAGNYLPCWWHWLCCGFLHPPHWHWAEIPAHTEF